MFAVWQNVNTSAIAYTNAGPLLAVAGFAGGDVDTLSEFNAVDASCGSAQQSPVIFDANGTVFNQLGFPSGVIGFAGPCTVNTQGRITSGMAALNGKWIDNNGANGELTDDEFDAAFIHEFGHFSGLDHSQAGIECAFGICEEGAEDGIATMFPFLIGPAQKTLAADDLAWISRLYPSGTFNSQYGTVEGTVYFFGGPVPAQGINIVARSLDDPGTLVREDRANIITVVSGYLFTESLGQTMSGTNNEGSPFGGRDPALIGLYSFSLPPGTYTLEMESIFPEFIGGSGVGPLSPPFPLTGGPHQKHSVSVLAGASTNGKDFDSVGAGEQELFDRFESPGFPGQWGSLLKSRELESRGGDH
jgi:hypothetical protein